METRNVPRTRLWREGDGFVIVLECVCGEAVGYPGHPDDREESTCECGRTYRAVAPEEVPVS